MSAQRTTTCTLCACASDTGGDHDARALAWHGLRPSEATPCPRVVAGKRCRRLARGWGSASACVCEEHQWLMDHTRVWLDTEGRHVLTTEPYGSCGLKVAAFVQAMDELGLRTTVTGASPWNPGSTFAIIVRRSRP